MSLAMTLVFFVVPTLCFTVGVLAGLDLFTCDPGGEE